MFRPGSTTEDRPIDVVMLDLICNTPFYDRYLAEALLDRGVRLRLGIASFDREPTYFQRHGLPIGRGLVDAVGQLGLGDGPVRRALKALEWGANQCSVAGWIASAPPDVLHIQWLTFVGKLPVEPWFIRFTQAMGVKVVYTVHDLLPHERSGDDYLAYRSVYRLADGLICHTQASRDELVERFRIAPHKIGVIPHGALFHDVRSPSREEARSSFGYRDTQVAVVCSGMLRPYKGIEFLLEAWPSVVSRYPDALLVIAGRAKDPAYLDHLKRRLRQIGLGDSVRLDARYLPEEDMVRYHAAADILVYPYREITQSGALLTGMGFGKAIVATAVGGLSETLQDGQNALLVRYGDVEGLADRLAYLAERPSERRRLGAAARTELEREYAWPRIAERTIEFYRDLLGAAAGAKVWSVGA